MSAFVFETPSNMIDAGLSNEYSLLCADKIGNYLCFVRMRRKHLPLNFSLQSKKKNLKIVHVSVDTYQPVEALQEAPLSL